MQKARGVKGKSNFDHRFVAKFYGRCDARQAFFPFQISENLTHIIEGIFVEKSVYFNISKRGGS